MLHNPNIIIKFEIKNIMDKQLIIKELKQGFTVSELARKYHVNNEQIANIKRSLKIPTAKVIKKILQYPDFE